MSGGIEVQRLLQAVEHFKSRTRGSELPEGTEKALEALSTALSTPLPDRDTPGGRAALKVAPGTKGTGEHFSKAAKGTDGLSPGQRAAAGVSGDIEKAAAEIASRASA